MEEFRQARRLVDEDVTVFGEQLSDLHIETLTTELDRDMRADYQAALDLYEESKEALRGRGPGRGAGIVKVLDDGRFRLACVLAARDGVELPQRREPCFFNPQHGPAVKDVAWAPPAGSNARWPSAAPTPSPRGGEEPEIRLVRVGDRYVPWYAAEAASQAAGRRPIAALTGRRAHSWGRHPHRPPRAEATPTGPNNPAAGGGVGGGGVGRSQTRCSRRAASAIEPLIDG